MGRQSLVSAYNVLCHWITWLPFALPLLYTFPITGSFPNELLRAALLEVAGVIALVRIISDGRWKQLPVKTLGLLVVVMLLSLLRAPDVMSSWLGRYGDYQGLWLQLSALFVACLASYEVGRREWCQQAVKIMQLVCLLSLLIDLPNVLQGYRLAGLLLHDTGIGIYAAITLGLTLLLAARQRWWLVGLLSLAVVLSASRLAVGLVFLIIGLYALYLPGLRKQLVMLSVVMLCLIGLSTIWLQAPGRLDNSHRLHEGLSYRLTLYNWSLHHTGAHIIGSGSVSIQQAVRPRAGEPVPTALNDTLYYGFPLWYTHSQWLDLTIAYGLLGLAIFIYLIIRAFVRQWQAVRQSQPEKRRLALIGLTISIAMLWHLSLNTPSIELWPLVWLALLTLPPNISTIQATSP